MKTAKLITYLKTLSKKEIRLFDDFINSPFHNKSELVIKLWTYLKRYAPTFDHKKLEKSLVIKHLYKENTPNSLKRFNDLTVTCCKLFEQYIQIQHLANNKNYQERILVNAFGERQLDKAFYKTIDTSKRKITKKAIKDTLDYEQLLFLETERYYYPQTSKYDMQDNGMQVILDTINDYSELLALKNIAEAKQIEMFVNRQFDTTRINNNINIHNKTTTNTLVKINQLIIELCSSKEHNFEVINELNLLFKETYPLIQNRDERFGISNFLVNYASIHCSNDLRYYEILFQSLKLGIETKMLIDKNRLHEGYFINTSIVACSLGYVEWLETFIKKFILYIEKDKQVDVMNVGYANLYFAQKKYDKVLDLINQIDLDTSSLEYWYRGIEIRALFELEKLEGNYYDLLENKLEAFRRYCYRKKELTKNRVNSYLNFIKFIPVLMTWTTLPKKNKEDTIMKIKTEATVCRLWLLQKTI